MKNYNTLKTNSWEKFGNIKTLTKDDFERVCNNSESMAEACSKLGINFTTFKKHAQNYGCYKPNQGCANGRKNINPYKFNLDKWNNNELILTSRSVIRKWIFELQLLPIKCNNCNLSKWLEKEIPLELNHINGDGFDHKKSNIELLCPNCHALTDTYRGRNHKTVKIDKGREQIFEDNKNLIISKQNNKIIKVKSIKIEKRNRQTYFEEKNKNYLNLIQPKIELIKNEVDFSKTGWRLKVADIIKSSPSYAGNFIKKYIPDIWEMCWKHKT